MFNKLSPAEAEQSRAEKLELFMDVIKRRKTPDRVPLACNDGLWKLIDQDLKFSDALHDYDMLHEAVCKYHEMYGFDTYADYCTLNLVGFTEALGQERFVINDDPPSLQINDKFSMVPEDYPALIEKGIVKFAFEDLLCRHYEYQSKEEAIKHLRKAVEEMRKYNDYCDKVTNTMIQDYGTLGLCAGFYAAPFEYFVSGLRGLKNTSLDLRRHKDQLVEAMEAIDERNWNAFMSYAPYIENDGTFIFDSYLCPMAYTLLSPKQFEKFYWPWMKKYFDFVQEHDQTSFLYAEGSFMNKVEFFQDLEPNRFGVFVEQDDPVEVRQKLPNFTLIGGYPTTLLGENTEQECLDKIKEMMETVNYDGNWIFSFDKLASFKGDIKRENLLAVLDYLRSVKL